jgi:hypothetical protein
LLNEGFHRLGVVVGWIVEIIGLLLSAFLAEQGYYWSSIKAIVISAMLANAGYAAVWVCGWVVSGFVGAVQAQTKPFLERFEEFSGPILYVTVLICPLAIVGAAAGLSDGLFNIARSIALDDELAPLVPILITFSKVVSVFSDSAPWFLRFPADTILLIFLWGTLFLLGDVFTVQGWRNILHKRGHQFPGS